MQSCLIGLYTALDVCKRKYKVVFVVNIAENNTILLYIYLK